VKDFRMLCYGLLNKPIVFLCFFILLIDLGDMGVGGNRVCYCTLFIYLTY